MRKRRILTALLTLALLLTLLPAALAASPSLVVAMKIDSPWCVIGGETIQIDEQSGKVVPVIENDRTLVPIRRILEAFGGTVAWEAESRTVRCGLGGTSVEIPVDSTTALVNGQAVTLDVPAKIMNDRTFVPVRFVSENLGLTVEYEPANRIVVVANGAVDKNALTALPQVQTLAAKTAPAGEQPAPEEEKPAPAAWDPVTLTTQSYTLPSGTVSAKVITVDVADPRVTVKANVPYGLLNVTRGFSDICAASGATAVINANYFEAYRDIKDPVGHIMIDGQFIYGSTGISALGITSSGEMRYGRPAFFFRVKTVDGGTYQEWAAFEVNVLQQYANQSVLYTRARGESVPITYPGAVLVVENGASTAYRTVAAGESVTIPDNGYVLYSSNEVASTDYYRVPELGRQMAIEPYLFREDEEGFTVDGVRTIISGAPRLVKDGVIETYLEPTYAADARFTTNVSPRTAIGTTADNKLLLVSVPAANIQQMRELMLQLGCVDAINLDGGGSAAMYYEGQTLATPGRNLVTTLQIFVSE